MNDVTRPAVEWRDVTKRYADGHLALDSVNLAVAPGECLAILGTSGSGKTTLLKLVNRLIEPTSGVVLVHGKATTEWDTIKLRRSIGYVIQESGLMPHLDSKENVALGLRVRGVGSGERERKAESMLELVGLEAARIGPLRPHQLSGGQRQRVGVARALAIEPDLILMDEPFGALDPITRRELQKEFDALRKRLGKTVILVTHDIREAFALADRLAVMDQGRLVQVGTAEALMARPANAFVESFLEDARAVPTSAGRTGS